MGLAGRCGRYKWSAAALLALVSPLCAPAAQAAGNTASASGTAQAQVVGPIAAVELADLDFGVVAANAGRAGTVVVSPGPEATRYTGGARSGCNAASCAAPHAARFAVTGEANRSYVVSTPASVAAQGVQVSGGAAPALTVSGIAVRTASRPAAGPHGQLDAQGKDLFGVGGVLQVPAGLDAAHYRVSITVVLTYS